MSVFSCGGELAFESAPVATSLGRSHTHTCRLKSDMTGGVSVLFKTAIWKRVDVSSRSITSAPSVTLSPQAGSSAPAPGTSMLSSAPAATSDAQEDEEDVGMDVFTAGGTWLGFRRDLRSLSKADIVLKVLSQVEMVLRAMIRDMTRRNTDLAPLKSGSGSALTDCLLHVLGRRDSPTGANNDKVTTAYAKSGKAFALSKACQDLLAWRKAVKVKGLGLDRVPTSVSAMEE